MLRRFAGLAMAMVLPLCAIAAEPNTSNQEVIEDPLFRLEIPRDWKIELRGPPARVRGPNSELMVITVIVPRVENINSSNPVMSAQLDQFANAQIRSALSSEVAGMTITEPLKETTWNGRPFLKTRARNEKEDAFVGSFGLIGNSGAMFIVTVAGRLKDEAPAETAAESMLKAVVLKSRQ